MTVEKFLQNYGGNECVSIEGYCEEASYDYYAEVDEDFLSDDNPNHYKPTCVLTWRKNNGKQDKTEADSHKGIGRRTCTDKRVFFFKKTRKDVYGI